MSFGPAEANAVGMTCPRPVHAPEKASAEPRFLGADGIRAVACLWVVAGHLMMEMPSRQQFSSSPWTIVYDGHMGVAMFFVLSGFLLSMPFWKALAQHRGMPSIRTYAVRRLARIVPGYWVCVILTASFAGALSSRWDWITLFLTGAFLNWIFAATYLPQFNRPLWSVSVEMVFYILLPLTAWLMAKSRSMFGGCLVVILSILGVIASQHYYLDVAAPALEQWIGDRSLFNASPTTWATIQNPMALYGHFLIGVLAGCVYRCQPESSLVPGKRRSIMADLGALAIIVGLILCEGQPGRVLPVIAMMNYDFPIFPLAIATLLVLLPCSQYLGACLDQRFLRLTANWSFGIYLWHVPLIHGLKHVWSVSDDSLDAAICGFAVSVFLSAYMVAGLSYRYIELPILEWSRKITRGG